ncbi:putative transmembrane ascorbate ferrireductase 3 [Forsythia ovata]|uniref:ascorbate ferrireductase (transmembrane) n=1 Tax=Forsythia ovata TaxID=205694 RepID=A0ABD1W7N8_9LAMI
MHVMDSIDNHRYKYQKAAWQVTILAHLFGLIAILLMLIWLLHYRGGLDLDSDNPNLIFNVHPFLMFFGFIFMAGQAMMAYKTVRAARNVQKIVHMFIHTIAICLGVVGLHAVFKFHERRNITNLYSLHSWIGITTFSLFCLQWLFGFSLFLFPRGSQVHKSKGSSMARIWGKGTFVYGNMYS